MNQSILWQYRHGDRKNAFVGYLAGITAGVAYGTNPLFGKEVLAGGASVSAVLFFRYLFATIFMGLLMVERKESFRVSRKQIPFLVILGLFFSASSLLLFCAYNCIPAGLATTVVYIYPIFTAVIMAILRVRQPWQIWGSVLLTIFGVFEPITAIAVGTIAFGEPFTANVASGAMICIAGIAIMIVSGNKNHTI